MSYAKKAASVPRGRGKVQHNQAHTVTKEQEKLLEFLRRDREPKTPPETRVIKPVTNIEFAQRRPPAFGNLQGLRKPSNLIFKKETDEEKKERIKREVHKLESPFIWNPVQVKRGGAYNLLERDQEKDEEIVDERKFKWRNFIFQLVTSYELYHKKDLTQAVNKLQSLNKTILDLSTCREWLYLGAKEALDHVVKASLAFIYIEQNLVNEAEMLLHEILPVKGMRRANKAAIHGIKAAVFMEYGHQGNLNALNEAKEAMALDRTTPEWPFLVGKSIRRIRKITQCHELVSFEEIDAFKKAEERDKSNPLYKVYLAQVIKERMYRDFKKFNPESGSEKFNQLKKANGAACFMYKKAREMRPDCPHLLARCAYGMMKTVPGFNLNLKFIRESVDKAIELAPNNPFAHHVKAIYYERFHVEIDIALAEMKIAANLGNFGAAMDLVRMHHHLKRPNIVEELESVAESFPEQRELEVVYSQAGSYLLFIQKDIIEALKYYIKAINLDPESYAMKSHKSIFLRMKYPVNMFDVLLEELDTSTEWKSFTAEDKKVLTEFRIKARRHDSSNKTTTTERLTVEKILEMSRNLIMVHAEKMSMREQRKLEKKIKQRKKWLGRKIRGRSGKIQGGQSKKSTSTEDKNDTKEKPERGGVSRGRGGSESRGMGRGKNQSNKVNKERESSISSVDSDYQRDSTKFGRRGFFFGESSENLNSENSFALSPIRDPFRKEPIDSRFYSSRLTLDEPESLRSRDSSICSTSSTESERGAMDLRYQKTLHESRFTQTHANTTDEKSQLSVKNLQTFDLMNPNIFKPRSLSMLSLSSSGSGNQSSCSEGLSVMDRLKQSYSMLDYKKNNNEPMQEKKGKKKKFTKSESSQSLDKQQTNPSGPGKFTNKTNFRRSDSTQSLDVQQTTSFKNQFFDGYRPSFSSRDSSVESTRSLSFMPSFARKSSESESEKG